MDVFISVIVAITGFLFGLYLGAVLVDDYKENIMDGSPIVIEKKLYKCKKL